MKLYDLVGKDKTQGFSPNVWRVRMALAHKGLEVEMVPLIFTEIPNIEGVEAKTVPILEHDGKYITDSWHIACYLEETFPEKPSLFGGDEGKAYAHFIHFSSSYNLTTPLFQALALDIFHALDERDRDYFRETREKRLGKTLEETAEHQAESLAAFVKQLWPYNQTLKTQDFFNGDSPAYVDYTMYGLFQWAKGVSPLKLLSEDEPLYAWRGRMDDLFDGLGKVIKVRS